MYLPGWVGTVSGLLRPFVAGWAPHQDSLFSLMLKALPLTEVTK